MHKEVSKNILSELSKKWMFSSLLSRFFIALAMLIFVSVLLFQLFAVPVYVSIISLVLLFIAAFILDKRWKVTEAEVSRLLNVTQPAMQESTHLILQPSASLNVLERLQRTKVEQELSLITIRDPFKKQLTISFIILSIALVTSFLLLKLPFSSKIVGQESFAKEASATSSFPEILLAEINNVSISITPPSYTGAGSRRQDKFNLLVEEGAAVAWQIQTNVPAKKISFIFNDGTVLQLLSDEKHGHWKARKLINASGFYQVRIDNRLSELYRIETIKDHPPSISIQSPQPSTSIKYGEPYKVNVKVALADDYGISTANIMCTISSGEGEAVKFKEQKISFESFLPGNKQYQLKRLIDCKTLGMQTGDELYLFINAVDNHNQQSRSDVYIITLEDTMNLTSENGMVTSLDIKPELFRSQRQIIIETEQLLKDKSSITAEAFKKKSNDLGVDQSLLRLRYGKFLGEETNTEIGGDEHHDESDHGYRGNVDNSKEIMDQFSHKHDNAEDASFFDAATKKQLMETLSQMWKAELQLRTFLPKQALPYEYKALRLLKDLQQKSRAYVAKTGFKTTPLKMEKRLTGDLTKISQPLTQQSFGKSGDAAIATRKALGSLEQLKTNHTLSTSSREMLLQAFQQLSAKAAEQPAIYLPSLSALRKILNDTYHVKDIYNAEQGLQRMSSAVEKLPSATGGSRMSLSKQYFMNLNKRSRQ